MAAIVHTITPANCQTRIAGSCSNETWPIWFWIFTHLPTVELKAEKNTSHLGDAYPKSIAIITWDTLVLEQATFRWQPHIKIGTFELKIPLNKGGKLTGNVWLKVADGIAHNLHINIKGEEKSAYGKKNFHY